VTFAPIAEEDVTAIADDATPTATPANDEATSTPEVTPEEVGAAESTATPEGAEVDADDVEAITQESDADATATPTPEPAPEEVISSQPFAVTADGALTVTVPVRPAWLLLTMLDGGEIALTGMPLDGDEGEYAVEVLATDSAGIVITQSFTITVEIDPNPFRLGELSFTTEEDTPLDATFTAEHVEGSALFYGIDSEPRNGVIIAIDEASGAFTYEPLADFAGEDAFTIHISDDRQREITAPVTITVNAINDAPRIELETVYTVTVGEEVALPVVVTDIEGDPITVTVEALPPDLEYLDGMISGIIAPDATADSPYLTRIVARDAADAVTETEVTWNVVAVDVDGGDNDGGATTPTPTDEEPGATPTPTDSTAAPITMTAGSAARRMPGSDALAGYAWQPPVDFGDCPVVDDVLTPAPGDGSATLLDDAVADNPTGAPSLGFEVELAAGDYVLLVCGCAPNLTDADRTSPSDRNQALFASLDGVTILADDGAPVALSGFAGQLGFTWQAQLNGVDGAPAVFSMSEAGVRGIDLWMADDGVLVHAVSVVPASRAGEMIGQACVGDE